MSEWAAACQAALFPGSLCFDIRIVLLVLPPVPYQTHAYLLPLPLQVADFDFAPFAETAVLLYGAAVVAERYAGVGMAVLPARYLLSCLPTAVLLHMGWLAPPATRRFASLCSAHPMLC